MFILLNFFYLLTTKELVDLNGIQILCILYTVCTINYVIKFNNIFTDNYKAYNYVLIIAVMFVLYYINIIIKTVPLFNDYSAGNKLNCFSCTLAVAKPTLWMEMMLSKPCIQMYLQKIVKLHKFTTCN